MRWVRTFALQADRDEFDSHKVHHPIRKIISKKVTFKFPTKEHAQAFMKWLDGSGEQDYDMWTEENGPQVKRFSYNYKTQEIIGEE